jgi:hypothetical protein
MSQKGLRDALASQVPKWLANRPGRNVGYRFLFAIAIMFDALLEMFRQSLLAAWPGLGTPTAIPAIADMRGLIQGPTEPTSIFQGRLVGWLDAWAEAGSASSLARQIQAYLIGQGNLGAGVLPIVRIVDRSGNWTIANADGSVTKTTTAAFDWDTVLGADDGSGHQSGATVAAWWSDMWIVIAPPSGTTPIYTRYTSTSDPAWLANFGESATLGGGMQIPLAVASDLRRIVAAWKGAHTYIRAIIWPSDATSYSPGTPTVDGTFGDWGKNVAGIEVPARPLAARFMIPSGGG